MYVPIIQSSPLAAETLTYPASPQFLPQEFLTIQKSCPASDPYPTNKTPWFNPYELQVKIPESYDWKLEASTAMANGPTVVKYF